MNFVIVTGLSGAGKSQAKKVFEDIGYFCIDNLPPRLIPSFVALLEENSEDIRSVGLFINVRGGRFFEGFERYIEELRAKGYQTSVLFLEASTPALVKRFKETRRTHPLDPGARLEDAIAQEQALMAPIRAKADAIIDTSTTTQQQLAHLITGSLEVHQTPALVVNILSFGFKKGLPMDADFVFDLRFLPNPFYVDELRAMTGMDEAVHDFVFESAVAREYLTRIEEMLALVLPQMRREGRQQVVVALGCTGGQHRSVSFAYRLDQSLQAAGYETALLHREQK